MRERRKAAERNFRRLEVDPFEFHLAERLSMTVGELRERMSSAEYVEWAGFYASQRKLGEQ